MLLNRQDLMKGDRDGVSACLFSVSHPDINVSQAIVCTNIKIKSECKALICFVQYPSIERREARRCARVLEGRAARRRGER